MSSSLSLRLAQLDLNSSRRSREVLVLKVNTLCDLYEQTERLHQETAVRFDRAVTGERPSFKQSLAMRLMVLEGVMNLLKKTLHRAHSQLQALSASY